jgi:hypothetical protein
MLTFVMAPKLLLVFHFLATQNLSAMTLEITHPILHKAIKNLDVSKEFKAMAKANGFKTLKDILDMPLHELPYKPQSGYRMLRELLDIVEISGLTQYIDQE